MKMVLIICLTVIICSSCDKTKLDFHKDKELTSVYSYDEINEIEKMVNYVENRILQLAGESDISLAYESFWSNFKRISSPSDLVIPFTDEEKFIFIESLDVNTIESFFKIDTCYGKVNYQDSIYTNLCGIKHLKLSYEGKFMKYLSEVGKKDSNFKAIYSMLKAGGDVPAGRYQGIANAYDIVDIQSTKWRLLFSFYVLRMEETIDTKIKRHFEKTEQ